MVPSALRSNCINTRFRFDIAIAVFLRRARGTTPHLGAMVVEDFRAGTTGARVPHVPEVVLITHASNAISGHADLIAPDLLRFVIAIVDRYPELFRRQAKALRQQRPGEANRVSLEIIPKGEIPQHFEEGMVARRIADASLYSPSPHAALAGDRTVVASLFPPCEHILELHHACIGKKQGGIVPGTRGLLGTISWPCS